MHTNRGQFMGSSNTKVYGRKSLYGLFLYMFCTLKKKSQFPCLSVGTLCTLSLHHNDILSQRLFFILLFFSVSWLVLQANINCHLSFLLQANAFLHKYFYLFLFCLFLHQFVCSFNIKKDNTLAKPMDRDRTTLWISLFNGGQRWGIYKVRAFFLASGVYISYINHSDLNQ